jgi:hypothetical protein
MHWWVGSCAPIQLVAMPAAATRQAERVQRVHGRDREPFEPSEVEGWAWRRAPGTGERRREQRRGWQQAARNEAPVIAIGSSLIHGIQLHLLAMRIHKIQTEHTRPEHQSQHRETAKAAPCGEARRAVAATEAVFTSITRPKGIIGPLGTALRVRGVSPRGLGKRGARAFFPQRRK